MSGQKPVTPTADSLKASLEAVKPRGLPPVHLWNPPFGGDIDMRIARDGTWYYQGGPISRPALVRLFSTILKIEEGKYYLVTPVEKVGITVEDAPFVAVDFDARGQGRDQRLTFTTNVDDTAIAGPDQPIRIEIDDTTGEPHPYVMIRAGLEARIDRKSFYRLVDLGCEHEGWFGVWSGGQFFGIQKQEQLP